MNIRDSQTFRTVMRFKFFMVIFVWGLIPLLIPAGYVSVLGLTLTRTQLPILRIWGSIVLLDTFVYIYMYRHPHVRLTKYLLLFGILDNAGIGLLHIILMPFMHIPWSLVASTPFQLFFGYWFFRFYKAGGFSEKGFT